MSHWKKHVEDCEKQIGKGWDVVHHWLDEYARIYFPSKIHRVHRHHREGVAKCIEKWGDDAGRAAIIHILEDEGKLLTKKEIHQKYNIEYNE